MSVKGTKGIFSSNNGAVAMGPVALWYGCFSGECIHNDEEGLGIARGPPIKQSSLLDGHTTIPTE